MSICVNCNTEFSQMGGTFIFCPHCGVRPFIDKNPLSKIESISEKRQSTGWKIPDSVIKQAME